MVIKHGLYLANQIGMTTLMIQSDSLEIVEVPRTGGFTSTAAARIIQDICIQATTFIKVEYFFVPGMLMS
jgi:hypothetical protein